MYKDLRRTRVFALRHIPSCTSVGPLVSDKSCVFLSHECHRTVLTDVATYLLGKFILVAGEKLVTLEAEPRSSANTQQVELRSSTKIVEILGDD